MVLPGCMACAWMCDCANSTVVDHSLETHVQWTARRSLLVPGTDSQVPELVRQLLQILIHGLVRRHHSTLADCSWQ
jgi:hypothetical protein